MPDVLGDVLAMIAPDTECIDGFYCNTCGRHEDRHQEKCERPINEIDISWEIAVVTLEEAAKAYAAAKFDERMFTYNPEAIKRTADKIRRFYGERHQRWQLDSMRGRR